MSEKCDMGTVLSSMSNIVQIFNKHAGEDGKLSKEEAAQLIKAACGEEKIDCNSKEFKEQFDLLDADKSGSICFDEFVTFVSVLARLIICPEQLCGKHVKIFE